MMVGIADGELVRKILMDTETFVVSESVSAPFDNIAPQGVLVNNGELWKRHRSGIRENVAKKTKLFKEKLLLVRLPLQHLSMPSK